MCSSGHSFAAVLVAALLVSAWGWAGGPDAGGTGTETTNDPLAALFATRIESGHGLLPGGWQQAIALSNRCARHLDGERYRCESLARTLILLDKECGKLTQLDERGVECVKRADWNALFIGSDQGAALCKEAQEALAAKRFVDARRLVTALVFVTRVRCAADLQKELNRLDPQPPPKDTDRSGFPQTVPSPILRYDEDPGRS